MNDSNLILLINNLPEQLETMTAHLTAAGYQVLSSTNKCQAVKIARYKPISLIISSLSTLAGEVSGLSRMIRGENSFYQTPILIIGELPKESPVVAGNLAAGAQIYLETPFEPLYFIAQVAQLIEQKKTQARLRENEEYFRFLTENNKDIITILSGDGTIIYESPSFKNLLGYDERDLIGRNAFEFVHPDDKDRIYSFFVEAFKSPATTAPMEYRFKHQNGSWCLLQSVGKNYHDAVKGKVAIINSRDITKRSKTEARLDLAMRTAKMIWWEWKINEDRITTGDNFEQIYGISKIEDASKGFDLLHPDDVERHRKLVLDAVNTGGSYHSEFRIIRPDNGATVWISENAAAIPNEKGEIVKLAGICLDITERRSAEIALLKSEEQLRQSQKLESIGRLAGGIAHDFNNMLTAINGYSDLILRTASADNSTHQRVLEIKKAGERSAALTHQLLAFSRQQILQPKLLDLNQVVSDMIRMLDRLIGEHVQLNIVLNPKASQVEADPGQLSQVIMNLVVNARDAMPKGGIVTIQTTNVYLSDQDVSQIPPTVPGNYVLLTVSDTGNGIDENTQSHIFEPFYTTKELGSGTGLGLATVYGIVKQSGGFIWVNSDIGKGTTFRIYLPQIFDEVEEISKLEQIKRLPSGTETVLLVEDEKMVRSLISQILESGGYTVIEAGDGVEALEICAQPETSIDLLVTDIVMPRMSGRELAEKLTKTRPHLRVLFTSGYTGNNTLPSEIVDFKADFIAKPFAPDMIVSKVRDLLDN